MSFLKHQILQNINLCSNIHKQHKTNILNNFVHQNQDLAPQGSPEWLAVRKYTIGGSEISTITGENCFNKLDNLVAQKVGFSRFNGNIACRWGKIFECVTQRLTERIFNIDHIYETGSLEGLIQNQRYSPDGLGVVKIHCESEVDGEIIETDEYCIVLFEYKSPYSSIPMGVIPKHYLPQVKTGLCSIPITDFAIFINNLYRKCSMGDLNMSLDYDTEFHSRDKKFVPEIVLSVGVNIFYQTPNQKLKFISMYNSLVNENKYTDSNDSDDSDNDAQNVFKQINTFQKPKYNSMPAIYKYIEKVISTTGEPAISIRDFGKSYYGDFNTLLEIYDKDLLSIHFCEPHICESYYDNSFLSAQNKKPKILDTLESSIENYKKEILEFPNIIGYLPWKLFKSDILYEERDPNYLDKYVGDIEKTLNIINDINESKTEFEKIKKFKKYFPKSKILKENGLDISDAFGFLPKNM
jgi:hypothetical protein